MENFIETEDVCTIFSIKERTVYRWIENGMPCHRLEDGPGNRYRYLESEIREWYLKNSSRQEKNER